MEKFQGKKGGCLSSILIIRVALSVCASEGRTYGTEINHSSSHVSRASSMRSGGPAAFEIGHRLCTGERRVE